MSTDGGVEKYVYPSLALLVALGLRLYPYLATGQPTMDAWAPIRNSEVLLELSPVDLESEVFDGYNNYWPGNSLFSSVFSLITGLEIVVAMPIGVPLAGGFTVLIFYALARRVLGDDKLSFIASLVLATAYTHAFFTAGATKETYANPLYVSLIFVFLMAGGLSRTVLFTLLSMALALSHHLTAFITIAILTSLTLANSLIRVVRGLDLDKSSFALSSLLAAIVALYFWIYAGKGLRMDLGLGVWLSAASYQVVAFALSLYLVLRSPVHSRARMLLACLAASALPLLILAMSMRTALIPGAPILPGRYLMYAIPFSTASLMAALGYGGLRREGEHYAALLWLAVVLGLEGYAMFGGSGIGLTLAYRGVNFLWPPLSLLFALGLSRLHSLVKLRARVAGPVAVMVVLVALNVYAIRAVVHGEERYLGYQHLYTPQEHTAGRWVAGLVRGAVAGDLKASYMLSGYFGLKVDVAGGYRYLSGERVEKPEALYVYEQMGRNGYLLGPYGIDLPKDWLERAFSMNLAYSNGYVYLYVGG